MEHLEKKWWFWLIVLIIIAIIIPKPTDISGGGLAAPSPTVTWYSKECPCIGIEYDSTPRLADAGHQYMCVGVPLACTCYQTIVDKEVNEESKKEIECW